MTVHVLLQSQCSWRTVWWCWEVVLLQKEATKGFIHPSCLAAILTAFRLLSKTQLASAQAVFSENASRTQANSSHFNASQARLRLIHVGKDCSWIRNQEKVINLFSDRTLGANKWHEWASVCTVQLWYMIMHLEGMHLKCILQLIFSHI